jgi:IS5 family transposase
MARTLKNRAFKKPYISPRQLRIEGFSTPFSEHLDPSNRWVRLAHEIPWDGIVNIYLSQLNNHQTGASNINPRIVLGALMVKHMLNISDEDTMQMIVRTSTSSTSWASTVSHRKPPSIHHCS